MLVKLAMLAVFVPLLLFAGWFIASSGPAKLNVADKAWPGADAADMAARSVLFDRKTELRLDIWKPAGSSRNDRAPVVVFFYGGSWNSGSRTDYGFAGRALAAQGFVVIIPDYRKVPDVRWPTYLQDSAAAVAWVQGNIGQYGGDADRIALMGHSAGAYNAAMLALDPRWLRGVGRDPVALRGVVTLAGPFDFLPSTDPDVIAAMGDVRPPEQTQPIAHARGDAPPMLLLHGAADTKVRPRNSDVLAAAITGAGGQAAVRHYPGVDHADILMALARPFRGKAPVLADTADWLRGVTARRIGGQATSQ